MVIVGLMTLTLFQDHRCIRDINCKLCFVDPCPLYFKCCMVAQYIGKIMHNMNCATFVCIQGGVHVFGWSSVQAC